jgi:hypothetical protein
LTPRDEVLAAVASESKIKILAAMSKKSEDWWPKYQIQKETSIRPTLLRDNLSHLVNCDWIETQGITGARRFRLKLSNPRTVSFLKFLHEVDYFSKA